MNVDKANFCVIYKQNKKRKTKQKESLPEASSITDTRGEKKRVKEKQVLSVY